MSRCALCQQEQHICMYAVHKGPRVQSTQGIETQYSFQFLLTEMLCLN